MTAFLFKPLVTRPRGNFGVMLMPEHKPTALQAWGTVGMHEEDPFSSQRNWLRDPAESNISFFLQLRRPKGLPEMAGAAGDKVCNVLFGCCGSQRRHCLVLPVPLFSLNWHLQAEVVLLSSLFLNYTIYSFSSCNQFPFIQP